MEWIKNKKAEREGKRAERNGKRGKEETIIKKPRGRGLVVGFREGGKEGEAMEKEGTWREEERRKGIEEGGGD